MGHKPSRKFNFCLNSPQNIFPKLFGTIEILFSKCVMSLVMLGPSHGCHFCLVESRTLTSTEATEACCSLDTVPVSCDLLDESLLHSWSNFGRLASPGRFTTAPTFLQLWIMMLFIAHWSPKPLQMAL